MTETELVFKELVQQLQAGPEQTVEFKTSTSSCGVHNLWRGVTKKWKRLTSKSKENREKSVQKALWKHKRNHLIVSLSIKPTIYKGADIRGFTVTDGVDSKLTDEEIKRKAAIASIANDMK